LWWINGKVHLIENSFDTVSPLYFSKYRTQYFSNLFETSQINVFVIAGFQGNTLQKFPKLFTPNHSLQGKILCKYSLIFLCSFIFRTCVKIHEDLVR